MTTHSETAGFLRDYRALIPADRCRLRAAIDDFVTDLPTGHFRAELRVQRVDGHPKVLEMTWAPNRRATFEFGDEASSGSDAHIVWRRVSGHPIVGST